MIRLLLCLALVGCGGSPAAVPLTPCSATGTSNNASIGSPITYVDGQWHTVPAGQSISGRWVVRGTNEDKDYVALDPVWYTPSDGTTEPRPWWTLTQDAQGLRSHVTKTADNTSPVELVARSGSFINDALNTPVCLNRQPVITLDYSITAAVGATIRAAVGIVMIDGAGNEFTIEQNLARSWRWNVCTDPRYMAQFDRCEPTLWYFSPPVLPGPIDVRALVMQTPGMTDIRADSLRLTGVYIGSEIFGAGQLDMTISNYSMKASK